MTAQPESQQALPIPGLVAVNARTVHHPAGPCRACGYATLPGHRVADLPGGGLVHVTCTRRLP